MGSLSRWGCTLLGAGGLWLISAIGPGDRAGPVAPAFPADETVTADTRADGAIALADVLSFEAPGVQLAGVDDRDLASDPLLAANAGRLAAIDDPLPATYVLINVPQARLWMVRDGEIVGSMAVIVGRPDQPTPEMQTELTHVVLNPRWNVPQDIVRSQLAPEAARTRGRSLADGGYEVMSSWENDARRVSPDTIDWPAVAAGRIAVPVRQKPSASNAMGAAKYVMTNADGIYLHDTPDRDLFAVQDRALSAGCIRLEDHARLLDFLIPEPLPPLANEDRPTFVRLGTPVPIYLTYITAVATDAGPLLFSDPYRRDS